MNILGPFTLFSTIATPWDMWSALNILLLFTGSYKNIKEAMYIHVNDPSLNRNLGKYQLPHIWTRFCKIHQLSNSNNPALTSSLHGLIHPSTIIVRGTYNFIDKFPCGVPFIPCTSSHTPITQNIPNSPTSHFIGAIFGKYIHLFR